MVQSIKLVTLIAPVALIVNYIFFYRMIVGVVEKTLAKFRKNMEAIPTHERIQKYNAMKVIDEILGIDFGCICASWVLLILDILRHHHIGDLSAFFMLVVLIVHILSMCIIKYIIKSRNL